MNYTELNVLTDEAIIETKSSRRLQVRIVWRFYRVEKSLSFQQVVALFAFYGKISLKGFSCCHLVISHNFISPDQFLDPISSQVVANIIQEF